jgi:hypothetical protein
MRSCIIVCLSVVVCPFVPLCAGEPASDLSKFPKLKGKVVETLGNFGAFVPPKAGYSFQLDLKEAPKLKALFFDEERRRPDAAAAIPYVNLPAPFAVHVVRYKANGTFRNLRLISKNARRTVTIDVVRDDPEDTILRVWVISQEDDRVLAVALLECEADGAFPSRPK